MQQDNIERIRKEIDDLMVPWDRGDLLSQDEIKALARKIWDLQEAGGTDRDTNFGGVSEEIRET